MHPLARAQVVDAYRYLPRSVAYLPPPDELSGLMHQAGFAEVAQKPLSGGIAQLLTAARKAGPGPGSG